MAEVVLFHHAQGLTPGVRHLADRLRRAGHTVHVPDLYDGRVFAGLAEGVAHAQDVGLGTLLERARRAVADLPARIVYAGLSLGVLPAQLLAQTRPGAAGAVLVSACVPVSEFGDGWPDGVPVQVHAMTDDAVFVGDGDLDAARALVAGASAAELVLHPGAQHLFADDSLPSYDERATARLTARVLDLLARVADGGAGDGR